MAQYYKPSPMDRVDVGRGRGSPGGRNRGSGKLAGTQNSVYQGNLLRQNSNNRKPGGGFNLPLGGFGGGGKGGAYFAEEDLARQLAYDKAIWERSTPNVNGVGANVKWDRDTNTVSSALTEDNQSIYDSAFDRQGMFGGQVDYLAAGGWEDAQQKRFEQMQAMFVDQDLEADAKRKEASYNTGESTTQRMMSDIAFNKNINNRELGLINQAFTESQRLIDSNIDRQSGYLTQRGTLENMADGLIQTPTPDTRGNMANVSTASTRWADNLAMEDFKKAKGKSDFFSSLMSGFSGGMFT